ncbi:MULTISPECIES: hypothetical protein [Cyanophyceae]|uniref:hypothetical protein n=1 Tax=Cyanophyceae TaxID=3028117 RepID=UPI0016827999|nr:MULTISPECIES: hypothetical protein [Cyanophyceae]MBD1918944.1 hypothetical protein [Phormidium sp. FACHB-77]MBD2033214.1 hypothetical protein [Phormidium sp. FACHB-322]MBD2053853.1 hypothetical protein [Leptolyngbya sp. FACHB-60]
MGRRDRCLNRCLVPGVFAAVGVPLLMIGVPLWAVVPHADANHAKEVARLPVTTAATLNERGARVLIEGQVSDRMAFSDRPPVVAYNEYHPGSEGRVYAPTLWVQIPGKEVEVTAGYRIRSTLSQVGIYRSSFEVNDPVLVLGTLSVTGDRPVVSAAEIGFETKETYLASLHEQSMNRQMGLLFSVLGSLLTLGGGLDLYLIWRRIRGDW